MCGLEVSKGKLRAPAPVEWFLVNTLAPPRLAPGTVADDDGPPVDREPSNRVLNLIALCGETDCSLK